MTRPFTLALCLPLVLAACGTPRERCVAAAGQELRTLTRLAAETRGNVQRGYAVEEYQEIREIPGFCDVRNDSGEVVDREFCRRTQVRDRERPVTIDLAAERQKLAQLERRISAERERVAQATRLCAATYPE